MQLAPPLGGGDRGGRSVVCREWERVGDGPFDSVYDYTMTARDDSSMSDVYRTT